MIAPFRAGIFAAMSNVAEIEAAIKMLPDSEVERLSKWLDAYRQRDSASPCVESWLKQARGAAVPGTTTREVMKLTRGEE